MASKVLLQKPGAPKIKNGVVGFSWTTLFFQWFVPLFRGDWKTFFLVFIISVLIYIPTANVFFVAASNGVQNSFTAESIAGNIWYLLQTLWGALLSFGGGFFYNKLYTQNLINKGWRPLTQADEDLLIKHKIKLPADYELHTVSKHE